MRAIAYSFWALVITVALLTTAVIKFMTEDPEPPQVADTSSEPIVCYEAYGAPVEPEYILNGSVVLVQFIAEEDMPDGMEAYAQYSVDFDTNTSLCVITTILPIRVLGDSKMDALGHELLHCITGSFHP